MRRGFLILLVMLLCSFSLASEIGLVLSGGGAKGAYEVGAWKALLDMGFEIGGVYGASAGSINAAAVAMGDFEVARDAWLNLTYDHVMKLSPELEQIVASYGKGITLDQISKLLREISKTGGVDVDPMKEYLSAIISEEKIRAAEIDMGLVVYDVTDARDEMLYKEDIPEGELVDYVLASGNFPIFQRQKIDGLTFMDGGVYSNIPVEMALKKGYKDIVAIIIGGERLEDVLVDIECVLDNSIEVKKIRPKIQYGSVLDFDPEIAIKYVAEGYLDTLRAYSVISGDYIYIYESEDPVEILFISMSNEEILEASGILGITPLKDAPAEYIYYRHILPLFERGLHTKLPIQTSIKLLDEIAGILGTERLELYSGRTLLEAIKKDIEENNGKELEGLIASRNAGTIVGFFEYLLTHAMKFPEDPEGYQEYKEKFEYVRTVKK